MQQTILALGALIILAGVTLTYNANIAQSHKIQSDLQLEVMASGIAIQVMDMLSFSAFDDRVTQARLDAEGKPDVGDFSTFSSAGDFGALSACDLAKPGLNKGVCEDLDDFSMDASTWVDFDFELGKADTVPFEVHVEIVYVDPSNTDIHFSGSTTSGSKKAIVKVRSDYSSRGQTPLITLERVFSYTD